MAWYALVVLLLAPDICALKIKVSKSLSTSGLTTSAPYTEFVRTVSQPCIDRQWATPTLKPFRLIPIVLTLHENLEILHVPPTLLLCEMMASAAGAEAIWELLRRRGRDDAVQPTDAAAPRP
ncbi:hypothetical protein EVG20_g9229 [Dentipellis fragilis]|uniref:Secreted protein n=1 Tax=Dentipellis fragilis TaxID=205917 RepID=A0A4Y9Y009_9AGAM|nr:hypothetical protein EVG20_g9229 [Dentipellis fragilis]